MDSIEFGVNNISKSNGKKITMKKETSKCEETRKRSCSKSPDRKVKREKKENISFDIPHNELGDYYCVVCDAHMNSELMWESHIKGKRHIKNSRKGYPVAQKYEYSNKEPAIQKELDKETRPIAGLEHLIENLHDDKPPTYHCFLCSANFSSSKLLIEHITGLKHQVAFVKTHDEKKYALVESSEPSKSFLQSFVQNFISEYEQEHGRGKMPVRKEKGKSELSSSYIKRNDNEDTCSASKSDWHSPSESSRYSSPSSSKHSPPPRSRRSSRHSHSRRSSRHSHSRRSSRHSHSHSRRSSRHSPPLRSSRHSPPLRSSRHSPPLRSSRHSLTESVRMKEKNCESEWQKIFSEDRDRRYFDRMHNSDDPVLAFYTKAPTHQKILDSKSEQTYNDNCSWPTADSGMYPRAILDQRKSLGMISGVTRAKMDVPPVSFPSETNNFSDPLQLFREMPSEMFLQLVMRKLNNIDDQEIYLNVLEHVGHRAKELLLHMRKNVLAQDLEEKDKGTNNMAEVSHQNYLEFIRNLNALLEHFKSRKSTYENVLSSEQYSDNTPSYHQFNNNSGWNQRENSFPSFIHAPPVIPGLTLLEDLEQLDHSNNF